MRPALVPQLRETAEMLKIGHSIFALPFALASAALAFAQEESFHARTLFWMLFCAVCARTAAMAQNRLVDADVDGENPRTSLRALPSGRVTRGFVLTIVVVASLLFVLGAWRLNRLCLLLSPVVLVVLLGYPWAKRFTALCHFWLGCALGLAPVGAWVAIRAGWGGISTALLLGGAVLFWTAGFDLIYACQDFEFDRKRRLFSIPARRGIPFALQLSALLHVASIALLAILGWQNVHLHRIYAVGLIAAAAVLSYEHAIVSPRDLSRVNVAFFTLNGIVSLLLGASVCLDALMF